MINITKLASDNDTFRAKLPLGKFWNEEDEPHDFYIYKLSDKEQMVITDGIRNHGDWMAISIMVKTFKNFNEDNDPYHEHDFGSFVHKGVKIYFKIEYFEEGWEYGWDRETMAIEDIRRKMTILLASEY